jgi:hypothetical protein
MIMFVEKQKISENETRKDTQPNIFCRKSKQKLVCQFTTIYSMIIGESTHFGTPRGELVPDKANHCGGLDKCKAYVCNLDMIHNTYPLR